MINILDWFDLLRILLWFVNVIIAQCSIITIGTLKTYYFIFLWKNPLMNGWKGKKRRQTKVTHWKDLTNIRERSPLFFLPSELKKQYAACALTTSCSRHWTSVYSIFLWEISLEISTNGDGSKNMAMGKKKLKVKKEEKKEKKENCWSGRYTLWAQILQA